VRQVCALGLDSALARVIPEELANSDWDMGIVLHGRGTETKLLCSDRQPRVPG
jgi:hypothetical protein